MFFTEKLDDARFEVIYCQIPPNTQLSWVKTFYIQSKTKAVVWR